MKNNQLTPTTLPKMLEEKKNEAANFPSIAGKGFPAVFMDIFQEKWAPMQQNPFFFANGPAVPLAREPRWSANLTWSENSFLQNANWSQTAQTQKKPEPPGLGVRGRNTKFTKALLERGICPKASRRKDPVLNHTEVVQGHSKASSFVQHIHHHDYQISCSSCGKNAFSWPNLLLELLYW